MVRVSIVRSVGVALSLTVGATFCVVATAGNPTPLGTWTTIDDVSHRPRSLVFTPDGKRAYVTSEVDGTVWVLDAPGRKRIAVLTMPTGSKTMGSAVSPDGKRVYVSNGRGGTVSVIDVATDSILATVPVGQRPWGIAVTPDGRKLYTANGPSNDVSVVDAERLTVEKKIPVGKVPWGVALGEAP